MGKYISIEDFSENIAGVSVKTVKKHIDQIPGIITIDGKLMALKGTRYPCWIKKYKIRSGEERRWLLLKAIDDSKYIDHIMLGIYEEDFKELLLDLTNAELIRKKKSYNKAGANKYVTTDKGKIYASHRKERGLRELALLCSEAAGRFVKAYYSPC